MKTTSEPRGQTAIICKVLQHKDGYTAQELLAETGGTTPHNSYSLQLIADRFGYDFVSHKGSEYEDGLMRYRFVRKAARKAVSTRRAGKAKAVKAAAASTKRPAKKTAKSRA
jgi:hypothetical protein